MLSSQKVYQVSWYQFAIMIYSGCKDDLSMDIYRPLNVAVKVYSSKLISSRILFFFVHADVSSLRLDR